MAKTLQFRMPTKRELAWMGKVEMLCGDLAGIRWSASQWARAVSSHRPGEKPGGAFIAVCDNQIAGGICFCEQPPYFQIRRMAVSPLFRRIGIGSKLVSMAYQTAVASKANGLFVYVPSQCSAFANFVVRLGFELDVPVDGLVSKKRSCRFVYDVDFTGRGLRC